MRNPWFYIVCLLPALCLAPRLLSAQATDNLRLKSITISNDSLQLDTLSIIPATFRISRSDGTPCPETFYRLDAASALLIFDTEKLRAAGLLADEFVLTYRVFPLLLTRTYRHKELDPPEAKTNDVDKPFIYSIDSRQEDLFKWGGLTKNGSISRGLSFGNNQDVVVNSSMNLQLSGQLGDGIGILAAITDNNIPIQPEGNTQQIQDFDKVYIQLFTKTARLTAGDFELTRPSSYFLNLNKRAQGGYLTSVFELRDKNGQKQGTLDIGAAGALARGKYARNQLTTLEGNQGPYKLTGSEGESYIIVLAGTEKVYLDGQLLQRGAELDYVIDYNLGEITFTPEHLITKDKRIVVEFEYSEKSYARSMYFARIGYTAKRGQVGFHYYGEQDLRNQPLQQDLSEEEKNLLFSIGDQLDLAMVANYDSIAFNNDEALYKMVDTVVNAVLYDSIFVYSTSPDSAHYRLGFANVGVGRGNYVQQQGVVNGRVFRWVAPVAGVPQGSWEPVRLLVAPRQQQMLTVDGSYRIGKSTLVAAEVGMSQLDRNKFSPQEGGDNAGYAARLTIENRWRLGRDSTKAWSLVSGLQHEYVSAYFNPVERYRSVEFTRDWNSAGSTAAIDEQLPGLSLGFENARNQFFRYRFRSFLKGSLYKAYRHTFEAAYDYKNFFLTLSGAYLSSQARDHNSLYYRQKASLVKKFKWLSLGFREEQEHNLLRFPGADSLLNGSLAFEEYELFLSSNDTARTRFQGHYTHRNDRLPSLNGLFLASSSDEAGLGLELTRNPSNQLKIKGSWRQLGITDSTLTQAQEENTLLGRIEFFTRKLKKVLTSNTFYEAGSGLEIKKEFSYLEVPAGQGIYAWTDYNGNNVKELNEFDVAAFADQANYIRVFTPTSEYMRAYYSQFSEGLNLEPGNVWSNKKGLRKFISRFALQFAYRVERKSSDANLLRAYNPFLSSVGDSTLILLNSSLRGSLYFNRSHPKAGADLTYQDSRNKSLLMNGFDARTQQLLTFHLRWNITRKIMMNLNATYGKKTSLSDYLNNRSYVLYYNETNPQFQYQPGKRWRISLQYKYANKVNAYGISGERSEIHNAGLEIKYNTPAKGSLTARFNYLRVAFNATENTALAYDMLEGYKKGNNATWNLAWQRNLSENLQMNLVYDGRQTAGNKTVHVGSVQLRAYF